MPFRVRTEKIELPHLIIFATLPKKKHLKSEQRDRFLCGLIEKFWTNWHILYRVGVSAVLPFELLRIVQNDSTDPPVLE
jgi:hypothetical protein